MSIDVLWGSATHTGCVRSMNQDATLAGPDLFIVADGMGGHAAGEVASAVAVAHLARAGEHRPLHPHDVAAAVESANAEILGLASQDEAMRGMGTTVAGLALVEVEGVEQVLVLNVGDSRVYRFHRGALNQVSLDHSVVGEMLRAGELDAGEARSHPSRNVVTRALGVDAELDADSWLLAPIPGDRFVVCSDGLTNEVADEELAEAIRNLAGEPQAVADTLLTLALDRGARDNVSVVVVEVAGLRAGESDDEDTNPRLQTVASEAGDDVAADEPEAGTDLITGVPSFEAAPTGGPVED